MQTAKSMKLQRLFDISSIKKSSSGLERASKHCLYSEWQCWRVRLAIGTKSSAFRKSLKPKMPSVLRHLNMDVCEVDERRRANFMIIEFYSINGKCTMNVCQYVLDDGGPGKDDI